MLPSVSTMQSYLGFLVLVTVVGAGLSSSDVKWTSLHVKWSFGSFVSYFAKTAFYEMPLTKEAAAKDGWEQAKQLDHASVWCRKNDTTVGMLYDDQGSVAGIQVCLLQEDVDKTPYKWQEHKLFFSDNLLNVDVVCGRYYLVPQEVLKNGGRASFDEIGTGVWLVSGDSLVEIPRKVDDMVKKSWTRENCIPGMGRHYYYNISEEMDCQSMEPYFVLTDAYKNEMQGVGFQTFGPKSKTKEGARDWLENVPALAVKPTLPNAPDCLVKWAGDYGVLSLHMYFVDRPYLITCPIF